MTSRNRTHNNSEKNRLMKKFAVFIALLILFSGLCPLNVSAQGLTFKQALEKMYADNESLKASEAAIDMNEYTKKAARGLYFPKIWVNGKQTHIDDDIIIDLNDIRTVIGTIHPAYAATLPSFETKVQNSHYSNANINLSWMLFTGGKITAVNKAAEAKVAESKEQMLYVKSVLTTELAKRYYGYILSIKAIQVYKQALAAIEQHLNQSRKLENNGMLATSERLHAEVAYAEALRKHNKSIRKTKISLAGLKNTLSSEEAIEPASSLFITREIKPLEEYLNNAKQRNHILKKIKTKKNQVAQNYNAKFSANMPKVYLFGKYELYKDDLTLLEPEWAAGVGVNLSVFEGFSDFNKIRAAKKLQEQVDHTAAKAKSDILTLVEKKYNELMMEIEQYEALETSMVAAKENSRVQKQAFKAGMTTSLSVVDAQLTLSKVRIEKLNAVYGFDVALAELLEVCGVSEKYESYQNNDDVEVLL